MIKTVENLEKELKQGNLACLYLLYGEETFLIDTILKKIKNNFGTLQKGINYITLEDTNIKTIISDMETPAFCFDKKLIIARDTALFKKDGRKKVQANAEIVNKISNYIEENIKVMQESVVVVFVEQEIEKNDLYKVIEKYGIITNFEELKPMQIVARLKVICNAYKVNVADSTLNYLIEVSGTNMQDLINEVRKLIEYAGENGNIEKKDIDLLCNKKLESVIFDLTDNLGKKNISQALQVLSNLLYAKEPMQKILITLYNHFKKLYITKLSEEYGKNLAESLGLKPNQLFLTKKYKMQAGYFTKKELRNIIEQLILLDTNSKSGKIDINIGVEAVLCAYCS